MSWSVGVGAPVWLKRVAMAVAIAALASACARPTSTEEFVRLSERSEDGLYHFELDMSDSLALYDVIFYSRIDCNNVKLASLRDFPMEITWTAPDSVRRFREKVYFPIHDETAGSGFYSKQYVIPYRTGLSPVKPGVWQMSVKVDADEHIPGFRGLGVVCSISQ